MLVLSLHNYAAHFVKCYQFVENIISLRLVKNAQMQGARNPESGVATNKERLLATPTSR